MSFLVQKRKIIGVDVIQMDGRLWRVNSPRDRRKCIRLQDVETLSLWHGSLRNEHTSSMQETPMDGEFFQAID
jgi:hypothetical protein